MKIYVDQSPDFVKYISATSGLTNIFLRIRLRTMEPFDRSSIDVVDGKSEDYHMALESITMYRRTATGRIARAMLAENNKADSVETIDPRNRGFGQARIESDRYYIRHRACTDRIRR